MFDVIDVDGSGVVNADEVAAFGQRVVRFVADGSIVGLQIGEDVTKM